MKTLNKYYLSKANKSNKRRKELFYKRLLNFFIIALPLSIALSYMIYDVINNKGLNL